MKQQFTMLKKGVIASLLMLFLFSCSREDLGRSGVVEQDFNLTGFTRVRAGDNINLVINQGAAFAVKAKGESNYVYDLEFSIAGSFLEIGYQTQVQKRPRMDIYITLPTLTSVVLGGAGSGTVTGFQDAPHVISAVLSGAADLTMNGTGVNMGVDISGGSRFTVTGATDDLYGNISGGSKLNAYGLTATEVDLSASGGATAQVNVVNSFFATATGGSKIYYKGNPGVKNIETSGGGQVIKE